MEKGGDRKKRKRGERERERLKKKKKTERESEWVREIERECVYVCVCERERERNWKRKQRERVNECEREIERECEFKCVCVCVREREGRNESKISMILAQNSANNQEYSHFTFATITGSKHQGSCLRISWCLLYWSISSNPSLCNLFWPTNH